MNVWSATPSCLLEGIRGNMKNILRWVGYALLRTFVHSMRVLSNLNETQRNMLLRWLNLLLELISNY